MTMAIGLGGCATTPYTPPQASGNAVLDFSRSGGLSGFFFYGNGNNCTDNKSLTHALYPLTNKTGTLVLNAHQRVAFGFFWNRGVATGWKTCSVLLSLVPQPDGKYGLVGQFDGDKCSMALVDLNNGGAPVAENVDVKRMGFVPSAGVRNQCVPVNPSPTPAGVK